MTFAVSEKPNLSIYNPSIAAISPCGQNRRVNSPFRCQDFLPTPFWRARYQQTIPVEQYSTLKVPRSLTQVKAYALHRCQSRLMDERIFFPSCVAVSRVVSLWLFNEKFPILSPVFTLGIFFSIVFCPTICSPAGVERRRNTGQSGAAKLYPQGGGRIQCTAMSETSSSQSSSGIIAVLVAIGSTPSWSERPK